MPTPNSLDFLNGGGQMGALMRAHDWSGTPLGPPEGWPLSLKTAVRVMFTSRQPIWIGWGPQLTYLYNDAYQAIVGGKHPWALGRPAEEVWREIWDYMKPLLATTLGGDEGVYIEEQLLLMERNGYPEETYYTFSYSPVPDDEGGVGGVICFNTDDTQRVIGERQLATLREQAASMANARSWREACERSAAALAANRRDVPFVLIYMAEPGRPGLQLIAAGGIEAGHPAAPRQVAPDAGDSWPFARVLASHEPASVDDLAARFDGTLPTGAWEDPPTRAMLFPIMPAGESGRAGVLVVGLNPYRLYGAGHRGFLGLAAGQVGAAIAQADAYEEERRRAEALAELDRAKTTFFSNVSHEFRTPLALLLGPLEDLLARATLGDGERPLAEEAHRNGLRLLKLVNTLLDFARVEAGRTQAMFEPVDLAELTAELASTFRSACQRAGLALAVDCPPLSEPVYVDRDMWERIVLNLLSNAFKFTLEGGIEVALREAPGGVALTVRDSGSGIPGAELPRLFDRFHRVEGTPGRSHEGSGIGLALVLDLVKLHGGRVAVESTLGQGSVFTVQLPTGAAHLPARQVRPGQAPTPVSARARTYADEALRWLPDAPAGADGPAPPARPPPDARPRERVLLADDNADMRDYVRRLLEPRYDVETVGDGEAALQAARRARPDLVLTDVMMPGLDGIGLVRELRRDGALGDVPIIVLSARAGVEAEIEGLETGADDYLVKPFNARELLARVGANIDLARLRAETAQRLRENERWCRELIGALPAAVYTTDARGRITFYNQAAARMWGREPVLGEDQWGGSWKLYRPDGTPLPLEDSPMAVALKERRPIRGAEAIVERPDGSRIPFIPYPTPLYDSEGELVGAVNMLVDITARRASELALGEESRRLETLNRTGALLSAELDLERLVQRVTDAGVELTGARFGAFFYNVLDEEGESYMLYTLSGVERAAFGDFPMPRNTAVFGPTFRGERVVRSGDITADPAYGRNAPYKGIPEGHPPVRSYLAVPVASRSGEVLGGLFFAHPEPDVFTEAAERVMVGVAAQAAVAIDNARLYQTAQREIGERVRAETQLRDLNETLENRVAEEIAARREAEAALQQAQKMEAIGQLTGGVAHDFNNLLQIVSGNLQLLARDVAGSPRGEQRVENALAGVARGAKLAAQLLAFSRRQPLEPKVVNVGRFVRGLDDMLRRALGEEIEVETSIAGGLWNTFADPGQIENALLNLAINARDAMNGRGRLTIEVGNATLDDDYSHAHSEVQPGQYVMLAVTDTGCGIAPDLLERVFEPFFSTKPEGKGTGLGLSMVYGFAKQSGGHVKIHSELDRGTTIKLYLPRAKAREDAEAAADPVPSAGGSETVLVVEDDDEVRATVVDLLGDLGYAVLKAPDAAAALAIVESGAAIDLLFTDVVMPGPLRSPELARRARERLPGLAVLFTSGYTEDAIVHGGRLDEGVSLISKPYTREALARKLRQVLAGRRRARPAVPAQRILLVEDDELVRADAAETLRDLGHQVREADYGPDALAVLQAHPIDVLVTDVGLPGMPGTELAARARQLHPAIAVVYATGADELPHGMRDDHPRTTLLTKPYDGASLTEGLRRVLGSGEGPV